MYTYLSSPKGTGVNQYQLIEDDKAVSYRRWIELIHEDESFVNYFIDLLVESEYEAFFWEVKPVAKDQLDEALEFVLVNSTILPGISANKRHFQSYFKEDNPVVSFANLSGDAQLIVPAPIAEDSAYAHLANFVRQAPREQIVLFWKKVAIEYNRLIGDDRKWLSTAGLGVPWLHVRVDSRPKYYRYQAFKK